MVVDAEFVEVPVGERRMRGFLMAPRGNDRHPGILFHSDIFQLTGPILRACTRLDGYPAEHAFVRDEGPRYDPVATDAAFAEAVAHLRDAFGRAS